MKFQNRYKKCYKLLALAFVFSGHSLHAQQNMEQELSDSLMVKTLFKQSTNLDFTKSVMGNLPGIFTQFNGMNGGSGLTMLRGVNTIFLNSSPYVNIDGALVKMSKGIAPFASGYEYSNTNFINPLDITNVDVENDGVSLSQYGGKGGNGILNVETQKGRMGASLIDVIARVGIQQTPLSNVSMMNGADYRAYLYDYMHDMGNSLVELNQMNIFNPNHQKYNHSTGWLGMIHQESTLFQDYKISFRGGDGDTKYLFSVGYGSSDGAIKPSGSDRLSMRINLDYKITQKIEISNYLNYTHSGAKFFGMGTDWDVHPLYLSLTKSPFFSSEDYNDAGIALNRPADVDELGKSNPTLLETNLQNRLKENRVDEVIKAKWRLNRNNQFNTLFSVSYVGTNEDMNRLSYGIVADEHRKRQNAKRSYSNYMLRWALWYQHQGKLAKEWNYSLSAGLTIENELERMQYGRRINASTDDFESLKYGDLDSASNINYSHKLLSGYVQGKLSYKDLFVLEGNAYMEGSSNFGEEGRWNLYGGADVMYKLYQDENSRLALVGSWSRVGNSDIRGSYQHTLYYPTQYMGYGGLYLGNIENEDIRPEITDNYEGGASLSLGSRVQVGAKYYYRKTNNLITQTSTSLEIGLDPQFDNNGVVTNSGIEANINALVYQDDKSSLRLFGSISTLKNKIEEMPNGKIIGQFDRFSSIAQEEGSIGDFYGYKVLGVYNTQESVDLKRADGTLYRAGDYKIEDLNGDGMINADDKQVIGSPLPDLFGGFGLSYEWKNLSVSSLFSYSIGNDVYNLFKQNLASMSDLGTPIAEAKYRWISESNTGDGYLPRAVFGDPSGNFNTSDRWVEDGSYVKLKQVSVAYRIPLKNQNAFFKGFDLFVNCNNLFTWSDYSGYNPEVFSSWNPMFRGVDTGVVPEARSFILGLKLTL